MVAVCGCWSSQREDRYTAIRGKLTFFGVGFSVISTFKAGMEAVDGVWMV